MSGVVPYRRDNSDLGLWGVSWPVDCPGMSVVVPYRRDNSDLGLWGVSWPVDCPGMSGVVPYRRDNSDLGLWGVSWPVDCPGMSGVVLYRRDNSDLRGNPTLGLVSRMTLGYPCFLGYPKDNFGTLWQSWTTLEISVATVMYRPPLHCF